MKLNTTDHITDLAGEPLTYDDKVEKITIGSALGNILMHPRTPKPGENSNKLKLYVLAKKLYQNKTVELNGDEIALLREFCETDVRFGQIVTGQILEILQ